MKQTKEFIVFRDKKTGAYLTEYHNRKAVLAFESTWSKDIEDAIYVSKETFKEENERYEGMLQAFEAEPLKVEAEYTLTTLDGEEPEEIKVDNQSKAKMLFDALDDIFGGDD
ncbi:hypothetical protein ACVRZP_06575 [Streptococcus gallolyticus subsp. gallolyticus]